jgi:hypothetical protein
MIRLSPKEMGERAELKFMDRAGDHGLYSSRPNGDSRPYDVIVDAPLPRIKRRRRQPQTGALSRVQVKSVATRYRGQYQVLAAHGNRKKRPYLPGEIEFLAVYIFPTNTWYILPLAALRGKMRLRFPAKPDPRHKFSPYLEAWHLLSATAIKPQPRRRPRLKQKA